MDLFHGTYNPDLRLLPSVRSRYGFRAFFCTPDRSLAEKYARFHAKTGVTGSGHLYQVKLPGIFHTIDFKSRDSYSSAFRNLIFRLYWEVTHPVRIINVYDSPGKDFPHLQRTEVIVVFDFSYVKELKLIQSWN